jgi:hypothetical protein
LRNKLTKHGLSATGDKADLVVRIEEWDRWNKFKVKELKPKLKSHGLAVSGNKDILIARLMAWRKNQNATSDARARAKKVTTLTLYLLKRPQASYRNSDKGKYIGLDAAWPSNTATTNKYTFVFEKDSEAQKLVDLFEIWRAWDTTIRELQNVIAQQEEFNFPGWDSQEIKDRAEVRMGLVFQRAAEGILSSDEDVRQKCLKQVEAILKQLELHLQGVKLGIETYSFLRVCPNCPMEKCFLFLSCLDGLWHQVDQGGKVCATNHSSETQPEHSVCPTGLQHDAQIWKDVEVVAANGGEDDIVDSEEEEEEDDHYGRDPREMDQVSVSVQ